MKRLWSTIMGLPVTWEREERPLGSINGLFMDPDNGKLIALHVGITKFIAPCDIQKWHEDKIVIERKDDLLTANHFLKLRGEGLYTAYLNGKFVFSRSGKYLGRFNDCEIDTTLDSIEKIHIAKGWFGIFWDHRTINVRDIDYVTRRGIYLRVDKEATIKFNKSAAPAQA